MLQDRQAIVWLLTFTRDSSVAKAIPRVVALELEHEGDPWNLVPNNSSIINLVVLQKLCMALQSELGITQAEFKRNHPAAI